MFSERSMVYLSVIETDTVASSPVIWEEMIMKALLHMAVLENSECIWKTQQKPEVAVSVSMT